MKYSTPKVKFNKDIRRLIALICAITIVLIAACSCSSKTSEAPTVGSSPETSSAAPSTTAPEETSAPETEPAQTEPLETEAPLFCDFSVALLTGFEGVDEGSYYQPIYEGIKDFCDPHSIQYACYPFEEYSSELISEAVEQAIADGYNVLVLPGWIYAVTILDLQDKYPDVKLIGTSIYESDLTHDYEAYESLSENAACFNPNEAQAGYLAGYAAVADGYTELGVVASFYSLSSLRYIYGFLQGADAAAQEYEANAHVKYGYHFPFDGENSLTGILSDWYQSGTQVIFDIDTGYTASCTAAMENNGKVIGSGTDARNTIAHQYSDDIYLTTAMTDWRAITFAALESIAKETWGDYSGKCNFMSLADGNFVALPTEPWKFSTFTEDAYLKVCSQLADGTRACNDDTEQAPSVSIDVDELGDLQ